MRDRTIHTVSTFLSTNICYYKEQNNNLMVETGHSLTIEMSQHQLLV